jgi:peptide/nickel transport system substrate-binding protein
MNRKMVRIVSMLAAFTMLFLVGGCGNNENAVQTSGTKEAVFGTVAYFGASNLNPADSYNGWYMSFFGAGETLFKLDSNYKANPWLVASYKTIDDYTWEFTLRDDVYFQNGEKMTAERVKASLDYMMGFNVRVPRPLHLMRSTPMGRF